MPEEKLSVKREIIPGITGSIEYDNPFFTMPAILQPYKVGMLSYTASLFATTIGYPLDSIKTRMQTHYYKNALDCFKTTITTEGFKGLFRGIVVPLISTSVSRSATVSLYTEAKPVIADIIPQYELSWIKSEDTRAFLNNFPISFASGAVAGATVTLFACPFELTKIFQQIIIVVSRDSKLKLNSDALPTKVHQVARDIVKYEGWRGLYSGYRYHITRDAFSSGLFYSIYEFVKLNFQDITRESHYLNDSWKNTIHALCVPFAGAVSGGITWLTVYPLDTVKAKYQRDVLNNIMRVKMGLKKKPIVSKMLQVPRRDMYKGLGPSITRSVCVTMIFFSSFEFLMTKIA